MYNVKSEKFCSLNRKFLLKKTAVLKNCQITAKK
jgi:hypothetical protein